MLVKTKGPGKPATGAAILIGSVFAACLLARWVSASSSVPPKPDRYVTDSAGVLRADRAEALNEKLAAFERETSTQILIWIAPKVPEGTTPEELGAAAIRSWGVGQKGKDNGLVFFVFPEDRKMRIATGYGLEGVVPDAVAKRIQSEVVKPFFLKGDFAGGVEAGVDALQAAARGEGKGTGRTAAETDQGAEGVWGVFRWLTWGTLAAVVLLAFGSVGAILIGAIRQNSGESGKGRKRSRGSGGGGAATFSSSSSSGSSDSSSSSSSFSGGGGDSGGGGSSDSW